MDTISIFKRWLLSQAWPDPATDALVKVAFSPKDQAKRQWRDWKAQHDIDDCTWPQFKLLVRISARLPEIDPDCSEIPRLTGMAKALWTQSQLQLNANAEAIDLLHAAGIQVCLLKSAALEASKMVPMSRRVTSDLDIVVRRNHLHRALQILKDASWTWGEADSDAAYRRCLANPGVNLQRQAGRHKEITDLDLHHQPIHLPFLAKQKVDQFWNNSKKAVFRGRKVHIPGPEHMLVITAMQGLRRFIPSHLSNGMWPFDMMDLLAAGHFNWDTTIELARDWNGAWQLLTCLAYLQEQCHFDVPGDVLSTLATDANPDTDLLQFYAQSSTFGPLKYINLPVRELVLLIAQKRFRFSARAELGRKQPL